MEKVCTLVHTLSPAYTSIEDSFLPAIADEKMKTSEQLLSYGACTYPAFYAEQGLV